MGTFTLQHQGHDLVVESWTEPGKKPNHARLLVDGEEVDRGQADEIGDLRLAKASEHHTKVSWWWTGRAYGVALVEPGHAEERRRRVAYTPPPGTRAARWHAWGEEHPRLWAARHVVVWGAGVLLGLLGLNLAVRWLTGWFSLDWLPDLPDLPSIPWPSAPAWWTSWWTWVGDTIARLADLLLGWVPDGPWVKLLVGLVVAVTVGVREVRKREQRRRADAEARRTTHEPRPGDRDDDSGDPGDPGDPA